MAQVKAGKLRAIAVNGTGRSTPSPEVPSLAEAGVPGVLLDFWNAAEAAPASMPAARTRLLADHISSIARTPEMRPPVSARLVGCGDGAGRPLGTHEDRHRRAGPHHHQPGHPR